MGWFIAQSLVFILIAFAVGLLVGWLIWGRRTKKSADGGGTSASAAESEAVTASDEPSEGAAADALAADIPGPSTESENREVEVPELAPEGQVADTDTVDADAIESEVEAEVVGSEPATVSEPDVEAAAVASVDTGADAAATESTTTDSEAAVDVAAVASVDAGAEADAIEPDTNIVEADAESEADAEETAATGVVAEAEAVAREAAEASSEREAEAAAAEPEPETESEDLQRIEGVGPKIEAALKAAGYTTYASLAAASDEELSAALKGQGIKFAPAVNSYNDQAQYLVDGDEDGLNEYQDYLIGGQDRKGVKFNEKVDFADVDEIEDAEERAEALAEDQAEVAAAEAGAPEVEAPELEPEPEAEPEPQDLQRIEGIGPKIEATLKAQGYPTYASIAGATEDELRAALKEGGVRFAPSATSWSRQAQYLVDGDEDGLNEYQDYLVGGQDRKGVKFTEKVDFTDVDEITDADDKAEALAEDAAEVAAVDAGAEGSGAKA